MSARNLPRGTSAAGVELRRTGSPSKGSTTWPASGAGGAAQAATKQRMMGRMELTSVGTMCGGFSSQGPSLALKGVGIRKLGVSRSG